MTNIYVAKVLNSTTADGVGFRTSIYSTGCSHGCLGCHNKSTWDLLSGTQTPIDNLMNTIISSECSGVTFTGGDPMFQVEAFTELARMIKEQTQKNIWCYTGFTYEQIAASDRLSVILPYIDVLVDGRFDISKRGNFRFRGSSNQRLVDVQKTNKLNEICFFE
ncbi:MAG: anaerobic ribonucleoside-triphosphate reductase activating protein [Bacteroidales bacterium]